MSFTEAPAGRGRVAEAAATAAGRTLPTYLPTRSGSRSRRRIGSRSRSIWSRRRRKKEEEVV